MSEPTGGYVQDEPGRADVPEPVTTHVCRHNGAAGACPKCERYMCRACYQTHGPTCAGPSSDDLLSAIRGALRERDMVTAAHLIRRLAVVDPPAAEAIYAVVQMGASRG